MRGEGERMEFLPCVGMKSQDEGTNVTSIHAHT